MTETDDLIDQLSQAEQRLQAAEASLDPHTPEDVEKLETKLIELNRILEAYEDRATGSGDFGGYVSFRATIDNFVDALPEDFPERDSFETMRESVDKRRLSKRDFAAARDAMEPAQERIEGLEQFRHAIEELETALDAVVGHIEILDENIVETERLLALTSLNLDAPVDQLKVPFQAYNDAVARDFASYMRDVPAVDVLDLFSLHHQYPLLELPEPPTQLRDFVSSEVPALTVHELLEYADYSSSKLAHFVDDPQAFRAAVATEQTYLERLDAEPFQLAWPPRSADQLAWRLRELRSLVNRFASESTISSLRAVEAETRDRESFEELRAVAQAIDSTSPSERKRITSGAVANELESYQTRRDRLEQARAETRALVDTKSL